MLYIQHSKFPHDKYTQLNFGLFCCTVITEDMTLITQFCEIKCWRTSADPEGGTGGPDPPWDLSEVGSCVEVWWVGEGVQRLFLPYYNQFFSGSLRSPILYKHITYIHTSKFNLVFSMERSSPYPNFEKNPASHPLHLWKEIFIFFLSRITRFSPLKPKKKSPDPPPRHIYNMKTTMSSVCLCTEGFAIVQKKSMPYRKINLYVNNCLESRFEAYFCRKGKNRQLSPFLALALLLSLSSFFFFFFFFACQNVRKVGPPWRKFLDPRLEGHG